MAPCVEEHRKHTSDRPLPEHTTPWLLRFFFAPIYIKSQSEYLGPSRFQGPHMPVSHG